MLTTPAPLIRLATKADAEEVLRLVYLMWDSFGFSPVEKAWQNDYRRVFSDAMERDELRIWVAQSATHPKSLVACGAAWVYQLLPAAWLPNGKMGYLQWFSTEPYWRGKGLGTQILTRCVEWLREQKCGRIHLHATSDAISLYRRFGFEETTFPNLWLTLETRS